MKSSGYTLCYFRSSSNSLNSLSTMGWRDCWCHCPWEGDTDMPCPQHFPQKPWQTSLLSTQPYLSTLGIGSNGKWHGMKLPDWAVPKIALVLGHLLFLYSLLNDFIHSFMWVSHHHLLLLWFLEQNLELSSKFEINYQGKRIGAKGHGEWDSPSPSPCLIWISNPELIEHLFSKTSQHQLALCLLTSDIESASESCCFLLTKVTSTSYSLSPACFSQPRPLGCSWVVLPAASYLAPAQLLLTPFHLLSTSWSIPQGPTDWDHTILFTDHCLPLILVSEQWGVG